MNETGDANAALLRQIAFNAEKNGWSTNPIQFTPHHQFEEKSSQHEHSVSHVRFHMTSSDNE